MATSWREPKKKSCTGRGRAERLKSIVSEPRGLKEQRLLTKAESGILLGEGWVRLL